MALPMYFFYEVGIISASFFKKAKPDQEEPEGQDMGETSKSGSGVLRPKPATAGSTGGDDDYVGVP